MQRLKRGKLSCMYITHSFMGSTIGQLRYLFFALYEDYTDFGRSFVQEFNGVYLERLARDLGDHGAVVKPFLGDIQKTRVDIESKNWTENERRQLKLVPSLLVISKDFHKFSPRSDPWLIFHFGERQYGDANGFAELDKTLKAITASVTDPTSEPEDLYKIARAMTNERPDLGLAFSLQPNIFGFSIDIIKAGSYLRGLIEDRRRPIGRRPGGSPANESRPSRQTMLKRMLTVAGRRRTR